MLLVDPLYQRCLAAECRARGVPVIFDEVFTGIWRLGALSAAHRLGIRPDIACYAKLLTGRTTICPALPAHGCGTSSHVQRRQTYSLRRLQGQRHAAFYRALILMEDMTVPF